VRQRSPDGGTVERPEAAIPEVADMHYVIRVAGHLSDDLLTAFPSLMATTQPVTTVLHGPLPDQAALTGVLNRLDELGVQIVEMIEVPTEPSMAMPLAGRRVR
jgi:hypothetical protein